jgi:hypothetical protein
MSQINPIMFIEDLVIMRIKPTSAYKMYDFITL